MVKWYFPSNDHGETKGINDSGVALFRGRPLQSLAREICQNSLDAARANTIEIEFSAFDIPSSNLPSRADLLNVFEKCAGFWSEQKAKTTKEFFSNAVDKISADRIPMLRISDFYTSGLTGSRKELNSDWTNLTKSSGVSDKKGTAGGSFGIGKFAPFACSDFSTVFYSTYDEEEVQASQGVSRLVTFKRDDGENTQGTGYYGEELNTPMPYTLDLDPSFTRVSGLYGTDIYIASYKYAGENWEDAIIISILDSFLGAIWKEKLIIRVGDIVIKKETLNDLIETYRDELTGFTDQYYEVLTSPNTKWIENENFIGLGEVSLGLLIGGQEKHRKVAMIRKTGMKIKDQDRLNGFVPFAGVMFIEGEKINNELRKLENPEHTKWEVDRPETSAECVKARELLRAINDFIKRELDALVAEGTAGDVDVAGLASILPDEMDDTNEQAIEEAVPDKIKEIDKKIIKKKPAQTAASNTGGTEGAEFEEGGYTDGSTVLEWIHKEKERKTKHEQESYPVDTTQEGERKIPIAKNIIPEKVRFICTDKSKGEYVLLFVPSSDGINGTLSLFLSAESQDYEAPILAATVTGNNSASVNKNQIRGISFEKGKPVRISFKLDYYDLCAMEVRASAN